jgi:GAF domain-containing protein
MTETPDADADAGTATPITAAEDADLRESLIGLSHLVMGQVGLQATLTQVATFAVLAIPGADGAGLTLFHNDRPDTVVATAPFVSEVDAVQYHLGEGPCILAAAQQQTVRSGSLAQDGTFPRFGPRAAMLGVHSVLSLPLLIGSKALGSMNVYAHSKDAFAPSAVHLGELFAIPAAISVQNAKALEHAQRLTIHLQAALTNRAVIDQALGILMSRSGYSADEAFAKIRAASQSENRKVAEIARRLVDEAVRRARARTTSN